MENVKVIFKGEKDEVVVSINYDHEKDDLNYEVHCEPEQPTEKSKLPYFFATAFLQMFNQPEDEAQDNSVQSDSGE